MYWLAVVLTNRHGMALVHNYHCIYKWVSTQIISHTMLFIQSITNVIYNGTSVITNMVQHLNCSYKTKLNACVTLNTLPQSLQANNWASTSAIETITEFFKRYVRFSHASRITLGAASPCRTMLKVRRLDMLPSIQGAPISIWSRNLILILLNQT